MSTTLTPRQQMIDALEARDIIVSNMARQREQANVRGLLNWYAPIGFKDGIPQYKQAVIDWFQRHKGTRVCPQTDIHLAVAYQTNLLSSQSATSKLQLNFLSGRLAEIEATLSSTQALLPAEEQLLSLSELQELEAANAPSHARYDEGQLAAASTSRATQQSADSVTQAALNAALSK